MSNAELDKLIAEKVMGWETKAIDADIFWGYYEYPLPEYIGGSSQFVPTYHEDAWMPCDDISQAFEAVDELQRTAQLPFRYEALIEGITARLGGYSAGYGATHSEAICRAIEAVLEAKDE